MKKENSKNEPYKKVLNKQYKKQNKEIEHNKYFDLIGLAILILLGIIIYSNSYNCAFHFDDLTNIIENLKIRNLSDIRGLWDYEHNRFIPNLTFAINYHYGKLNVWGYHFINLIIHLINSVLVWWLTILIFSSPVIKKIPVCKHKNSIAIFTALLFVSHPLATESVTYIVQRIASIAAMFYMLSVAFYLKARLMDRGNVSKYFLFAGSVISAILALHSKENSYTLPFIIVLVEIFFLQAKRLSINFKDYRVILLIVAFIGFILIAVFTFSFSVLDAIPPDIHNDFKTITASSYLFTQFIVIPKYIQLLSLPVNLNLDYNILISHSLFDIRTMLGFIFLSALIILGIYLYNRNRIISFGISWFFITLAIESSFIPISDLMFEHRTYLPSYGFLLALSTGIYLLLWDKFRTITITILLLIIVSNSLMTYSRNVIWLNEFSLWDDVISKSPDKARPYSYRGVQYIEQHKYQEAIRDLKKAIELNPRWVDAYSNLGYLSSKLNDYDQGIVYLNKAIELDSNYASAYNNRAEIYTLEKKYDEALIDYNKAIKIKPNYHSAYSNRGNIFTKQNKFEEALLDLNMAIELDSTYPNAYLNRGCLLNNMMRRKEALVDINKAIQLKNNYAEAYFNRGIVELNMKDKEKACMDLQNAERLGYNIAGDYYKKYCN